jgi:transcriptional regulator with XRE-family HTH domain
MERRTGIPRCRISWLEHGRAVPTIETLEKISDAFEIPVYRLLYDGDEVNQTVKASSKIATNENKRTVRKNEIRLFGELRDHLSRMHRDDQRLLLFIAEKMAGRAQRQPVASRGQDMGDGLDGDNKSGGGG